MQNLLKSFTAITLSALMLALAVPSSAQIRIQFGRGQSRYSEASRIARVAESKTRQFESMVYRSSERGRYDRDRDRDDDRYNDGFVDRARELEGQLGVVSQEFDRGADNGQVRSEIASALRIAESINNGMRYRHVSTGYGLVQQWGSVRAELNRLARLYNLRQLN